MSRPPSAKLVATIGSAARQLTAVAIALVVAVLLAHAAAASDATIEANANQKARTCQAAGGTAAVHYDFNADGSLNGIGVRCTGGTLDGMNCGFFDGYEACTNPFTRAPQTPVESTRPDAGTVVGGALEAPNQAVPAQSLDPSGG